MTSGNNSGDAGTYSNYYKADKDAKGNPQGYATAQNAVNTVLTDMKLPAEWAQPLMELIARESSFNPNAANPKSSAKGYFQFLDSTRNSYGGKNVNWNDPIAQTRAGIQYVIDKYGTPEDALRFWDERGFY